MANFVVTFRLSAGPFHTSSCDLLIAEMKRISFGSVYWGEANSFAAFRSDLSAERVRDALTHPSFFNPAKDFLMVIDIKHQRKAISGELIFPRTLSYCLGF